MKMLIFEFQIGVVGRYFLVASMKDFTNGLFQFVCLARGYCTLVGRGDMVYVLMFSFSEVRCVFYLLHGADTFPKAHKPSVPKMLVV